MGADLRDCRRLAAHATGVGLPMSSCSRHDGRMTPRPSATPMTNILRTAKLLVHPYTFRADRVPVWATSFTELLRAFCADLRVDGLFCDQPDIAVNVRNALYKQEK
jgi:glycerophosphoryl diester phosphodiesterase